jgi:hypothetical protein
LGREAKSLERIKTVAKWVVLTAIGLLAVVYVGDYGLVHYRAAHKTSKAPFETLTFRPTYAVPRKDGKDEFDFGDPQTQVCVHSLFPHFGYSPCWYAKKQAETPIPLLIVPRSSNH